MFRYNTIRFTIREHQIFVWSSAAFSGSVYFKCANSRKLKISFLRDFSTDQEDFLSFLPSTPAVQSSNLMGFFKLMKTSTGIYRELLSWGWWSGWEKAKG